MGDRAFGDGGLDGHAQHSRIASLLRVRLSPAYSLSRGCGRSDADAMAGLPQVGDQLLRDRLILTYAPLVKFVAGRVGASLPSHVDEQDIVSAWSPRPDRRDRAVRPRPRDQVRDLRDGPYPRRDHRRAALARLGPRSVRTARQIERAIATLEKELMRAPTDAEIAAKLGVTGEELEESLEISRSSVAALDGLWSPSGSGDQIALIDTIEDDSGPDRDVARADGDPRGARGVDLEPAGAREARGHALLLRRVDAP